MKRALFLSLVLTLIILAGCKQGGGSANEILVGEFASLTGKEATFGQSSHEEPCWR
jgi:branched-chain amino acid transport system substrate-binding protein